MRGNEHDTTILSSLHGRSCSTSLRNSLVARQHPFCSIVVIPKTHIESIDVLSSEHERIVLDAMRIISRVAAKVRAEHGGCRVSTNVGEYQDTPHLHWYVHAGRRIRDEAGREIE